MKKITQTSQVVEGGNCHYQKNIRVDLIISFPSTHQSTCFAYCRISTSFLICFSHFPLLKLLERLSLPSPPLVFFLPQWCCTLHLWVAKQSAVTICAQGLKTDNLVHCKSASNPISLAAPLDCKL